MVKIIDIIKHKDKYGGSRIIIVVDDPPSFKYERVGDLLVGEDSGFFNFYKHVKPSKHYQAFAGRKFDIPLKDGSIEKAHGQWWDHLPSDYYKLLYSVGVASIQQLNDCYVFRSMKVDREIVDDWLSKNDPSNNYYKYDKRSNNYGKQTIVI